MRIQIFFFFLFFFLWIRFSIILQRQKSKGGPPEFETWRHRRAHASRRELQASTSRGGCHLLRRCRVHRPSRFAPAPATDPARYRSIPRLVFPRRDRAAYAPAYRFESRRVHSAAITRAASEPRSSVLARDRATVSFTSRRRRSLQKIMVSATQRLDPAAARDSRAGRFGCAFDLIDRDRDVPRCSTFENCATRDTLVRHKQVGF